MRLDSYNLRKVTNKSKFRLPPRISSIFSLANASFSCSLPCIVWMRFSLSQRFTSIGNYNLRPQTDISDMNTNDYFSTVSTSQVAQKGALCCQQGSNLAYPFPRYSSPALHFPASECGVSSEQVSQQLLSSMVFTAAHSTEL